MQQLLPGRKMRSLTAIQDSHRSSSLPGSLPIPSLLHPLCVDGSFVPVRDSRVAIGTTCSAASHRSRGTRQRRESAALHSGGSSRSSRQRAPLCDAGHQGAHRMASPASQSLALQEVPDCCLSLAFRDCLHARRLAHRPQPRATGWSQLDGR
jgi:hypothetical protein